MHIKNKKEENREREINVKGKKGENKDREK
jgi:hypothetical protein